MPTKLNHAGNLQEYVPAGNGDASGEYGNSDGENKHFKNFKKPSRTKDLDKKQKYEIGNYISKRKGYETSRLIENLRYYSGTFGDLSKFTDEELTGIINDFLNTGNDNELVYFKKGSKWYMSRDKQLLDLQDIKYYTKEEKEQLEKDKNINLIEKSQTQQDREIQSIFKNSVVCFGKGYDKEDLNEIITASKNLVNDFGDLSGSVKEIGDRTNLEKYINAINSQKTFTEEEIQNEISKIKSYYYFGAPSDEALREEALKNLQNQISIKSIKNAYAYWNNSNKRMIFMPKMKQGRESLKRDYELNFHPSADNISVYYHEMGHAIDYLTSDMYKQAENNLLNIQDYSERYNKSVELRQIKQQYTQKLDELANQNYNKDFDSQLNNAYKEKYGEPNFNNYRYFSEKEELKKELFEKGIKKYNLSEYAKTNNAEFIAEAFAGHYCNANNELAEKTFGLIKDYYKKLKEFKI